MLNSVTQCDLEQLYVSPLCRSSLFDVPTDRLLSDNTEIWKLTAHMTFDSFQNSYIRNLTNLLIKYIVPIHMMWLLTGFIIMSTEPQQKYFSDI